MYEIVFYEDARGNCPVEVLIKELDQRASKDKQARTSLKSIRHYIDILQMFGTRAGEEFTKHIEDDVWELRPGSNRVMFFAYKNNTFVLLHWFRKTTQKTPKREIEKAKKEVEYWKKLHG